MNKAHGHEAGDALLAQLGRELRDLAGGNKVVRLGGDEFLVLLPKSSLGEAFDLGAAIAARITEIGAKWAFEGGNPGIGASVVACRWKDDPRATLRYMEIWLAQLKDWRAPIGRGDCVALVADLADQESLHQGTNSEGTKVIRFPNLDTEQYFRTVAAQLAGKEAYLVAVDIKRLSLVNYHHGPRAGDAALFDLVARLRALAPDLVAMPLRQGFDYGLAFVVLVPGDRQQADELARALEEPLVVEVPKPQEDAYRHGGKMFRFNSVQRSAASGTTLSARSSG